MYIFHFLLNNISHFTANNEILDIFNFFQQLEDGKARANFLMPNVFPTEQVFPKGKRLYVSVNVTEKGSGENDTIVDTSTFISHPYYKIDFDRADQYFKPGFPYTLKVRGSV